MNNEELIFIYNADGSVFGRITDFVHKIAKPTTYPCELCVITHGPFAMHAAWQSWLAKLDIPFKLLHRDEIGGTIKTIPPLPCIVIKHNDAEHVLLNKEEIAACDTVEKLIDQIETKRAAYTMHI